MGSGAHSDFARDFLGCARGGTNTTSSSPAKAGAQLGDASVDEQFYVYIMASKRNGTIYIGSTNDLVRRTWEHREGVVEGFTKQYGCHLLVWYEAQGDLESARVREVRMKAWKRAWKIREIEGLNPDWEDLYERIAQP